MIPLFNIYRKFNYAFYRWSQIQDLNLFTKHFAHLQFKLSWKLFSWVAQCKPIPGIHWNSLKCYSHREIVLSAYLTHSRQISFHSRSLFHCSRSFFATLSSSMNFIDIIIRNYIKHSNDYLVCFAQFISINELLSSSWLLQRATTIRRTNIACRPRKT